MSSGGSQHNQKVNNELGPYPPGDGLLKRKQVDVINLVDSRSKYVGVSCVCFRCRIFFGFFLGLSLLILSSVSLFLVSLLGFNGSRFWLLGSSSLGSQFHVGVLGALESLLEIIGDCRASS